jgi:hypothetical protein
VLKDLNDIISILPKIPPIIFLNHDVNYGIGMETILPNYYIIYSGKNSLSNSLKNHFFTSDYKKTSFELLSNKNVAEFLSNLKNPNLIFFKPNSKYFNLCKKQNWNVLNNNAALSLSLENIVVAT